MTKTQVLDIIYQALREDHSLGINSVTMDNGHKSGEIILTTDDMDGKKQTWVISSKDIRETEDEAK